MMIRRTIISHVFRLQDKYLSNLGFVISTMTVAGFYGLKVFALVTSPKIISLRHNQIANLQINVILKQA